jgi:hypothetical protein
MPLLPPWYPKAPCYQGLCVVGGDGIEPPTSWV